MLPKFSRERGFYADAFVQQTDPVTLKRSYQFTPETSIPLGFFVRGYAYKLLGLIPTDIHFFGVRRRGTDTPKFFLFGGDKFGRDIFSRILLGTRISLSIGVAAIVISFILGVSIGGISGYFGGWTDILIQRLIEVIDAFPKLPLWLALGASLPRNWTNLQVYFGITVILSLVGWTGMARVVRGKILSLREEDYALAARLMGAGHGRIIFSLTMTVPGMILGETSLSFLGLGLKPPTISWGVMLQDCMSMQVVKNYPWLLLPVLMIILTVLCFNFIGDGLRDAADPYTAR
jgi:peptide/nickel transport system permease protein